MASDSGRDIYFRRKAKVDERVLEVNQKYCLVPKEGGLSKGCVTIKSDGRYTVVVPEGAESSKFLAQASTVKDKDVIVEVGMDPGTGKAVLRAVYYPADKYSIEKVKKLAGVVLEKYRSGSEIVNEVVDKVFGDNVAFVDELKEALGNVKEGSAVVSDVGSDVREASGEGVQEDVVESSDVLSGSADVSVSDDQVMSGSVQDTGGSVRKRGSVQNIFDRILDGIASVIDSFFDTD